MLKNLLGQRFGRLFVAARLENKSENTYWLCICDCGQERSVGGSALRAGRRKSCGCAMKNPDTAGYIGGLTHKAWANMKYRCAKNAPQATRIHYYDKGIAVCDRWRSFLLFLEDMAECPPGLTMERNDCALGYSKDNCRWATRKEQANNTTRNKIIEYKGESRTVAQWAEKIGVSSNSLVHRLLRGWDTEKSIETPYSRRY